jgi:probable blue pigment (indigoidine) exporter
VFLGILLIILWVSGVVSVKFGLLSFPPLTMGMIRFLFAGGLQLLLIYVVRNGKLFILGVLNTFLYLCATFWYSKRFQQAFFNLAVVVNPFLV